MGMRTIGYRGANVLRGRPIEGQFSAPCHAPVETVYELLADIQSHLEWGGTRRSKISRLLSMEAPVGPAAVGTEFTSTGEDSMTRMSDRSVVTEAIPSRTFEFVTESSWRLKLSGKQVNWTIVHHYDIAPHPVGSRITYSLRATRATSLPGPLVIFRVPVVRSIVSRMSMGQLKGGMRNLIRMAEERTKSELDERRSGKDRSAGVHGSFDQEEELNMSAKGYISLPGEGESYWAVGAKGTIKGPNVYELENPPGWEVPLHVHDNEDEVHYYIEGEVAVTCGDDTFKGEPGSLAFLPKGVPHALKFGESSPARWLWISPQNRDAFFREAGVPTSQPEPKEEEIDMERMIGIFAKYGMRFLEDEAH
jgi:quercetin dioxygenase-like cupin family protein